MRIVLRILVSLWLTALAAGCGGPEEPSPVTGFLVQTEAVPHDPRDGCMAALAEGVLIADPRSGIALRHDGGIVFAVVWPFGYSGRVLDGRAALVDDRGVIVAMVGDHVSMGGGYLPPDDTFHPCGPITVVP